MMDPNEKSLKSEEDYSEQSSTQPNPYHQESFTVSDEMFLMILFYLDLQSLGRMSSVSKNFLRLSQENLLWQSFLLLEKQEGKSFKESVKAERNFFENLKQEYIEKNQHHLALPVLETSRNGRSRRRKLKELLKKGSDKELKKFLQKKRLQFKNAEFLEIIDLLLLALQENPENFRLLVQYLTSTKQWDQFESEITKEENRWLLLKCIEHKAEIQIHNLAVIFHAIDTNNLLLVKFWIAFDPQCLKKTILEFPVPVRPLKFALQYTRSQTGILREADFSRIASRIQLILFLIKSSCFQNKKLLKDTDIIEYFLCLSNLIKFQEFEKTIKFFDISDPDFLRYYLDRSREYRSYKKFDYKAEPDKFELLVKLFTPAAISQPLKKLPDGHTILHECFSWCFFSYSPRKSLPLCEILLKNGADPNIPDRQGKTVLHFLANVLFWIYDNADAEQEKINDFILLLVNDYHADLTIKDNEGKTPLELAKQRGNEFLCEIFAKCLEAKTSIKGEIKLSAHKNNVWHEIVKTSSESTEIQTININTETESLHPNDSSFSESNQP